MNGVWHRRQPDAFAQLNGDLHKKYPDLSAVLAGDFVQIQGGFPVVHEGVEIDRFQIRVVVPPEFPRRVPVVFELGGRVPLQNPEWHTYHNGGLCLIVPEEWLINPQHASLIAFLDGPVRNYFIAHALAEEGLGRPMGERPHGDAGLWEAYGEMVGSNEHRAIQGFLECLAGERLRGHWDCPCGSGKKLRNCHMPYLFELQKKIKPYVAESALMRLKKRTIKKEA
jgi:hypothetical protein